MESSLPDKRFLSLDDLSQMPQPQWLIEGLFERTSLVMLAGPSYSFKSFLLLDWLLCMASGRKWNNKITQTVKVAYALGEGKSSLIKRVRAWIVHNNLTEEEFARVNENFRITFDVPQFASKASTDNFLADLAAEGFKPEVVAVDTFARSFVGLDENDAKDTGLWIESADHLRQLGYGVIFLHHTKKSIEFGLQFRGSTAIIGAMDTAMTLERKGEQCTLKVTKQKDHDEGAPMLFRRHLVPLGDRDESCVLLPTLDMDERFQDVPLTPISEPLVEGPIEKLIETLRTDVRFPSDRARARELARLTGLSDMAAQSRIKRAKLGESSVSHDSLRLTATQSIESIA